MQRCLVYVEFGGGGVGAEDAARSQGQQSWNRALHRDASVVEEAGIDLRAVGILGPGESLLDRRDFLGRDACVVLAGFAGQDRGIEVAAEGIGDHAVRYAVARVALLHQRIHEQLAIVVGQELPNLRFAGSILRGCLVVSHRNPLADGKIG